MSDELSNKFWFDVLRSSLIPIRLSTYVKLL